MCFFTKSSKRTFGLFILGGAFITINAVCADEKVHPIAGLQPDTRPANAPVAKPLEKTTEWYQQAVTGVEEPYPASLQFLETQGKWYTPFTEPGMPGRYDIRGWHKEKK